MDRISDRLRIWMVTSLVVFGIFGGFVSCQSTKEKDPSVLISTKVTVEKIFITHSDRKILHNPDAEKIRFQLELLFLGIQSKNLEFLPRFMDRSSGLFVEWKGHWTWDQVVAELKKPDGYFALYFWDTEQLKQYKENPNAITLRDILVQSPQIELEFYFESVEECEVKLRIPNHPEWESYFQNSRWVQVHNSWRMVRMF